MLTRLSLGLLCLGLNPQAAVLGVIINPEGRVSVDRLPGHLQPPRCGATSSWLIRVTNEGFVTAPLWLKKLDGPGVQVELDDRKLSGAANEYRVLRVRVDTPREVDVTLQFDVGRDTADLGTRAQVHLLMSCR